MNPFKKRHQELVELSAFKPKNDKKIINEIEDNLFFKCNKCAKLMTQEKFEENYYICEHCGNHCYISSSKRISYILDENTFVEHDYNITTINTLEFPEYEEKIKKLQIKTKLRDAVVTGVGKIKGLDVAIAIMDTKFMMGSMGTVVGEKITRIIEHSTTENLPLVIFCASGGARMQEGILSLMQMAKTSAAIKRHSNKGLLFISVLTNPTTGGVTASFASLADIIMAEPKALIGFAGPRVIEQTIKQKLPKGFQSSEYLKQNGFIDIIINRKELKNKLAKLIELHGNKEVIL